MEVSSFLQAPEMQCRTALAAFRPGPRGALQLSRPCLGCARGVFAADHL